MEQFLSIIIMAVLVEAILTYVQEIRSWKSPLIFSMALGVAIALLYGLDLPSQLGVVPRVQFVGEILTGIILSRGSNYLYDLIGRFTNLKVKTPIKY